MRRMLTITQSRPLPALPAGQQPLAGLPAIPLQVGTRIQVPADTRLISLSVACDYRENIFLHARCGEQQVTIDASYAGHNQRLCIELPVVGQDLLIETIEGPSALWIIDANERFPQAAPMAHHQAASAAQADEHAGVGYFLDALADGCIAQFGWMLGCVVEACDDLAAATGQARWAQARDDYLRAYIADDGSLRYQDLRGRVIADHLRSEETGLPLAAWCRAHDPDCLRSTIVAQWLDEDPDADGFVSAEGSYCTAYPMLQLAAGLSAAHADVAAALRARAWRMLETRRDRLLSGGVLALRDRDGKRSFEQWARGWAWYLLGLARSLGIGQHQELHAHLQYCCRVIADHQRADGLWCNFVDDPSHLPDTSGSAGIAAALLHAAEVGACDADEANQRANNCWQGLQPFFMGGSWLQGNAPTNKRGEDFQRGTTRTCNAFGMGLAGQLHAGLLRSGMVATAR